MLNDRKLTSQTRQVAEAALLLLVETLARHRPADRVLAAFLRGRPQLGSRDRRLISETAFAILRWWGWLAPLAPPAFHQRLAEAAAAGPPPAPADEAGDEAPDTQPASAAATTGTPPSTRPAAVPPPDPGPAEAWHPLFLAAHALDGLTFPDISGYWTGTSPLRQNPTPAVAGQPRTETLATLGERAATLFRRFRVPPPAGGFQPAGLVPAWAPSLLAPAVPADTLLPWLQRRPPLWLRVQRGEPAAVLAELAAAGLCPEPHARLAGAVRVGDARINVFTLPAYREGRVEIQDLASQAVGAVCAPRPGERWWDACAGAGGKSLQLGALMANRGTVFATDIREYKLEDLRRRARRAGLCNIQCRGWDGKPLSPRKATFDGVLVDAPCSCSGTWRRNPGARWSAEADEPARLAALQRQILHAAASGVRPGGVLVYATCSLFRGENEDVVAAFLADHPQFQPEPFTDPITGETVSAGMRLFPPWAGDSDALFTARLHRQS
ncbi:MAG: class I SAM-dependent methyltransferase [Lentisphaeria bacterium]